MKAVALALGVSLLAVPALAQVVRDKESCRQAVEDAKQALSEAQIGEQSVAKAEDLIRISTHLCEEANFVYAEKLLAISRGMTAAE